MGGDNIWKEGPEFAWDVLYCFHSTTPGKNCIFKFTCLFSISPIRMQAPKMKGNVFLIFVVSLCLAWGTADSQEMFIE